MRFVHRAAVVAAALLASTDASADSTSAAAPVVAAPVEAAPVAAPALAAPQAVPVAPAYPAPPPYQPGYAPPYMVYFQPSAGALPPWMSAAPATQRNSNGMRTSGIVLFAAGAVLTAVGGVVFGAVATTGCPDVTVDDGVPDPRAAPEGSAERVRSARQALNGCDTSPVVGAGLIAAGMLTAAVGVPLFVIGSKRVPAQNVTGKLVPEVSLGAAHGSLRWLF